MKFSELSLHPQLQNNLDKIQFVECTKIQEQAIPWICKGKDIAGLAQTGTGKTGAFLIPTIDRILKSIAPVADQPEERAFKEWKKRQFVLVLVPTRELAEQVQEIAQKLLTDTGLSSVAIYGGTSYEKQIAGLKNGVEFVIATPGRFIDLYKEHLVDLGLVRAIVFDEADRMFDMGFKDDMRFILRRVPRDRQFLVFSATLNFDVLNVAYESGADPIEINISRDQAKAEHVKDYILHIGDNDKPHNLLSLLKKHEPRQAIIFSNFKHNVERLARFLNSNNIPAVGISSLLTQAQRNRVMEQFKADNDRNILVATDLAARGLDILGVDLVLNYELPDDPENYVHRIGRTGRAGQTGQAFSLVSDRDVDALQRIEEYLKHKVEAIWMDDADLVKDFKAMPASESRGHSGPPQKRREGGPRDRGERGGRDRDQRGGRRRDNRPPREARGGEQGQAPARGPGQGESHRDRSSGRHRNRHQQPRDGQPRADQQTQRGDQHARGETQTRGDQQQRRDQHPRREHPNRRGQGPQRDRQRSANGGHQKQWPQKSQSPRGQGSQKPGSAPLVAAGAQKGLGAKVSGFFKKLFGG